MRGRLLFPRLAEIARLDTDATAADPDGAGALTSGYDPVFRETIQVPLVPGSARGVSARKEMAPIRVPVQVEIGSLEDMQMLAGGQSPDGRVVLVCHFRDLERLGLVDEATGDALIRLNDRLVAIRTMRGKLIQEIRTPPGLYVTNIEPRMGLGETRNLLILTFEDREQGARG